MTVVGERQPCPEQLAAFPSTVHSHFVRVNGIRTHYLEAGQGEPLLLIHSGEFGGRAEFSWQNTLPALATRFHVFAPDLLGFGHTDLVYNFTDPIGSRVGHIRAFMEALCIPSAHFMGSSFGGGFVLAEAAKAQPCWSIRSIVSVSGGGFAPDNDARKVLTHYDGSREWMQRLLGVLVADPATWSHCDVDVRWRGSIEPGAWEAVAAARFARPGREKGFTGSGSRTDYTRIQVPVLIIGGAQDRLRLPGCWEDLHRNIKGSELSVFSRAAHLPHIEQPERFNEIALEFLSRHQTGDVL